VLMKSARMRVLQDKIRSVLCSKNNLGSSIKLLLPCQYVPGKGGPNLTAPRTTCRGPKEIFRAPPGLPAGAVRVVAPGGCCGGPHTVDTCATACKCYQLATLLAEATKHPYFSEILNICFTEM